MHAVERGELGLEQEVVYRIDVDVEARGRAGQEARPSPAVVLGIQQEVGADDRDTHGDDAQDERDEQHEAVHVVDLVRPERREDEVPAQR